MEIPRYLLHFDVENLQVEEVDLLVVGSGLAGLYTAAKAGERKIAILTKEKTEDSSTEFAQGGIAAVLSDEDSLDLHIKDTKTAGAGLCYPPAVEVLVNEGAGRVRELIAMGTAFDRIENSLDFTREGAHSRPRILHARGDATGEEIRRALVNHIQRLEWIDLYENTYALEIVLGPDGDCQGILAFDRNRGGFILFVAPYVVLAAGGCGHVYPNTSNPEVATGDGIAIAYRAGAELMDMEFIQFHPTTLYHSEETTFLISEALRGEGAVLRNKEGQRFMTRYHPQAELAPRDIVARAIFTEMQKDEREYVCLDITHKDRDFLEQRFPKIYRKCLELGYDLKEDCIPVRPAAHFIMGGVKTDIKGATNIPGLFACGENAATGVHGANRLASNSLLEGLVFGRRIALEGKKGGRPTPPVKMVKDQIAKDRRIGDDRELWRVRGRMQKVMMEEVGIVRSKESLKRALKELEELGPHLGFTYTRPAAWETQNLLIVAFNIARAALSREESRGSHFRSDFPKQRSSWEGKHIILNKDYKEGKIIELS